MKYYLAVDGGGSKTLALITNDSLEILSLGNSGPSNYQSVGIEEAIKNIEDAILKAKKSINFNYVFTSACFSLAGINSGVDYKRMLKRIAEKHYASKIKIVHDGEAALHATTLGKKGIIVILGTGSLVAGYDEKGNYYRSCDWGHILGDEGSAYRISIKVLSLILKGYDGRIPIPIIGYEIAKLIKIKSFDEIASYVYTDWKVKDIAKLASFIIGRAEKDRQIYEILREEADEISEGVKVISEKTKSKDVYLTGGIVSTIKNKIYIDLIKEMITSKIPDAKIKIVKMSSLLGAVVIAYKMDELNFDEKSLKLLKRNYRDFQKGLSIISWYH